MTGNGERSSAAGPGAQLRRSFLTGLPTGLPTLLTGVMGYAALLYLQGRGASFWVMSACAPFVGAGLALLLAVATWRQRPSPGLVFGFGALAGLVLVGAYMLITNPGACMVAWTQVMVYGAPRACVFGAVGSPALVGLLGFWRGSEPQGRKRAGRDQDEMCGGDRVMLAALLGTAVVAGAVMFPFIQNALAYSRLVTGTSLAVDHVRDGRGAGVVLVDGRVAVLQPWLSDLASVELLYPDGTACGFIEWELPEGAGGMHIHLDEPEGVAYVSWVEPAPGTGPSGDGEAWQSVLARLDVERALVSVEWTFPAETMPPHRIALVHGGYAVLTGDQEVICYALAGRHNPVETWRAEARGTELTRAAAGTVVVASYGAQPACYHLPTGGLFWRLEGEAAAVPVYDEVTRLWIVATGDAVVGLSAGEGAVWTVPRAADARHGGTTMAELFAHDGRVLVMERNPGPSWDWPPVNVKLTARDASDGHPLWETRLERAAFRVVGHVHGVTLVGGNEGLLLGIGESGKRVCRTRAGPVSAVVEGPDGTLLLLNEVGGIKVGRIR